MRVFVLTKRWAVPCQADEETIDVFADYDKAKEEFEKQSKEVLADYEDGPGLMLDTGVDCLEIWIDGEYSETYTTLTLSGYDVK